MQGAGLKLGPEARPPRGKGEVWSEEKKKNMNLDAGEIKETKRRSEVVTGKGKNLKKESAAACGTGEKKGAAIKLARISRKMKKKKNTKGKGET